MCAKLLIALVMCTMLAGCGNDAQNGDDGAGAYPISGSIQPGLTTTGLYETVPPFEHADVERTHVYRADFGSSMTAPDQRGYNLSDKPRGVASYRMDTLVADVIGIADALGLEHFNLAGHDFGGIVSWLLAVEYPELLKRLSIANVPHPVVMRRYVRSHPAQMLKSWYAYSFQIPALPERIMRVGNWRMLMGAMPEALSQEERDRYRGAWAQPGAMTGMINWYRSLIRHTPRRTGSPRIAVPTLVVWGKQDPYISYEMAPLSVELCENGRLVTLEDATHWVMHDKPEEVSQLLIEHFWSE